MKLAVTGKGGVGKTTISALVAVTLRSMGRTVFAIDADPDSNLLACMGYRSPESVPPLVELKELIKERMGVEPGTTGGMFRLNPEVGDIPEKYGVDVDGIRVLVAGAVKKGGSGCYCPENGLIRSLISHLLMDTGSSLVLDMEAGVEHLSRGTLEAVDCLLVVVEPGRRSVETAARIRKMAAEIGLERVVAVGNRVRSESDAEFMRESLPDIDFVGMVPYDSAIVDAERDGRSVAGASAGVSEAVRAVVQRVESETRQERGESPPWLKK